MSKVIKAFKWAFWPAVFGMAWALLAIGIYDRFAHENMTTVFYSESLDATCLTTAVRGKSVIFCLPGDRMPGVEAD